MRSVEPRVYLLAEPRINWPETAAWLTDVCGPESEKVLVRIIGSDAEQLTELAARRCYKSFLPNLNPNILKIREDSKEYHENLLSSGHGSVLEHANFTFAFEFVSRVFTHELVRHRAGCAYSQESLRYVRLTELGFWIPPEIAANPEASQLFRDTVMTLEAAQKKLEGIFASELSGKFSKKKALTSAFRRIAPDGLATGIIATFNTRALRHILALRTSEGAEVEIRATFDMVGKICWARWPMLFQDFERTESPDGIGTWVPRHDKV